MKDIQGSIAGRKSSTNKTTGKKNMHLGLKAHLEVRMAWQARSREVVVDKPHPCPHLSAQHARSIFPESTIPQLTTRAPGCFLLIAP